MQWDSFLSKFLTMQGIGEQFGVKGGVLSNYPNGPTFAKQ